MIQYTTVAHKFTLPIDSTLISKAIVMYRQRDVLLKIDNPVIENDTIIVNLTQEQSAKFNNGIVQVQLNIVTIDGNRLASRIVNIECFDNLLDEVI